LQTYGEQLETQMQPQPAQQEIVLQPADQAEPQHLRTFIWCSENVTAVDRVFIDETEEIVEMTQEKDSQKGTKNQDSVE
jgi:hypothetical protein